MTPIAPLPQNLDLHEGEEFDLKAVAKNGVLVVTRIMRLHVESKPAVKPTGKPTFSQKWGGTMSKVEDPTDPLLTHINEKHVK